MFAGNSGSPHDFPQVWIDADFRPSMPRLACGLCVAKNSHARGRDLLLYTPDAVARAAASLRRFRAGTVPPRQILKLQDGLGEANFSTERSPAKAAARFSGAHGDTRGAGDPQAPPRERSQAPV